MDVKVPICSFDDLNTPLKPTLSFVELCKHSFHIRNNSSPQRIKLTLDDVNIPPIHEILGKMPILRVDKYDLYPAVEGLKLVAQFKYISYLGFTHFILKLDFITSATLKSILDILDNDFPSLTFSILWDLSNDSLTWSKWFALHSNLNNDNRVSLFLQMSNVELTELKLWLYQPIKYIHIKESISNNNCLLFLQKLHQLKCLEHPGIVFDSSIKPDQAQSILSAMKEAPPLLDEISLNLRNMLLEANVSSGEITNPKFMLQAPLEPAIVDLPNTIYQTFESDAFKYEKYSKAILCAMIKLEQYIHKGSLELICVGPGRGPLVDELFKAIEYLHLNHDKLNISVVEHNSAVMPFLEYKNKHSWDSKVTLYCEDIRNWNPRKTFDWWGQIRETPFNGFHLIFSELIGSFGCNELMPEVLAPLAKFQNTFDECIWIPQSLDCYIAPVHSPSIWSMSNDIESNISVPIISDFLYLSNPVKVWSFDYTNPQFETFSREFQGGIEFTEDSILHGFAGHFKAVLFPGIELDNLPQIPKSWDSPQSKSNSWLPIYMHSKEQLVIPKCHKMEIKFARESNEHTLSYSWVTGKYNGSFTFNLW